MLHKVSDIRNIRVKYMCHIIANDINDLFSELRGKKARHRTKSEINIYTTRGNLCEIIRHVHVFMKLIA